ncbi:tripartite tricarboxylate transporter permease [Jannaschia sp. LMIT008]|uniref:tripartite tricarboxylate transporter permease n=1 Tax=Jannaschia maritima TaxID=3032585 RepID=UPI0028110F1A|nr:tripartite tricarboxylate transporter permease [Jannaschia sp. LMIT008]
MIDGGAIAAGAALLLDWQVPVLILGGMVLGLVIGAIPGMTAALGLAAILPLTFQLDALPALILMTAVYTGSLTGGGFLAILINTPGTPGAAATTFDGYPMAKAGRQNEALGLQIAASVIGGAISYLALLAFIEPMARFALLFGSGEMLFLTIFVILMIATLQRRSFARTIFAGVIGLLLSTIGTSVTTGIPRGTMGLDALEDGLPVILCVIGLFALPELIAIVARPAIAEGATRGTDIRRMMGGVRQGFGAVATWARGSAIGTLVGLLPAAGATVASLLSYAAASKRARASERFGEGEPKGVVAAESANNASEGGAMAVLMALGVPGSASTAVISGAFLLHGLVPGPRLFIDNGPLVYGLILGNLAQMAMLGLFAVLVASQVVRIVTVPSRLLAPILAVVLALGAYSFRGLWEDVVITFAFGLLGHVMRRHHFPLIALMIGLFLGRQIDADFVRFVILYGDDPMALLSRPIVATFAVLSLGLVLWQVRQAWTERRSA